MFFFRRLDQCILSRVKNTLSNNFYFLTLVIKRLIKLGQAFFCNSQICQTYFWGIYVSHFCCQISAGASFRGGRMWLMFCHPPPFQQCWWGLSLPPSLLQWCCCYPQNNGPSFLLSLILLPLYKNKDFSLFLFLAMAHFFSSTRIFCRRQNRRRRHPMFLGFAMEGRREGGFPAVWVSAEGGGLTGRPDQERKVNILSQNRAFLLGMQ